MKADCYPIDELPSALLARWDSLLVESPTFQSPFLSYAFCKSVNIVRGAVQVIHLQNNEGEEGFLPFQYKRWRALLGHAEKVGAHFSDQFGIIGNIRNVQNLSGILLRNKVSALRFDHADPAMCPFEYEDRQMATGSRLAIDSFPALEKRLRSENKNFVKHVYRAERRLQDECGTAVFQWHSDSAHKETDRIISTKRAQYEATRAEDAFKAEWTIRLLHELVKCGDRPTCRPVISTLYVNREWVASNFALVCGNTMHVWFPTYNKEYSRYKPGHLLFFKIIEHASKEGIRVFDFGAGVSRYKAEYRGDIYDLSKGRVNASTIMGQFERYLTAIKWRAQAITAKHRKARLIPEDIEAD